MIPTFGTVGFGGGSDDIGNPYVAIAVDFDGSTDYITRGADLTGSADSKLVTGSMWFKRGATGVLYRLVGIEGARFQVKLLSGNDVQILANDVDPSINLSVDSGVHADTNWHHLLFSFDMADTGKRHLYIDDVDELNVVTYNNTAIEFTRSDHSIGAGILGQDKLNGCLADVWLDYGRYTDFSVTSERRKFVDSNIKPVDLGSDGSTPFTVKPIQYFSGAVASWQTNKGDGGGFTEEGTFVACADSPSD